MRPAVAPVGAENQANGLGPPRAHEAAEADNLAGPDRHADAADARSAPEVLDAEHLLADAPVLGLREERRQRAADHHADHVLDARLARRRHADDAAVLHHRHAVGDAEHFLETVGNVDDTDALGAEPCDDAVQAFGVGGREHRGRLVEDDDPDLLRQGLGDFDHLLVGDREVADRTPRVDGKAQAPEQFSGAAVQRRPGYDARQLAHEDVLGDRQVGREGGFLVNHRDAMLGRDPRAIGRDRRAVDEDRAAVGGDLARQHPHQRRLARAVLAEERVDLAGLEIEIDPLQRAHASERPRDVPQLDERAHQSSLAGSGIRTPRWA